MGKKSKIVHDEPLHTREFTLDELKFIREAIDYHASCWGNSCSEAYASLLKSVRKKI